MNQKVVFMCAGLFLSAVSVQAAAPAASATAEASAAGALVGINYDKVATIMSHINQENVVLHGKIGYGRAMGSMSALVTEGEAELAKLKAERPYPELYEQIAKIVNQIDRENIVLNGKIGYGRSMGNMSMIVAEGEAELAKLKAARPYPELYDRIAGMVNHFKREQAVLSNKISYGRSMGIPAMVTEGEAELERLKAERPA